MIKTYIKQIYNRKNLKGYFNRNKNSIILVLVIFAISLIVGYAFNDIFKGYILEAMKHIAEDVSTNPNILTSNIFFNNLNVAIIIILFGILFSVVSVIILFLNGVVIGFVFNLASIPVTLIYILPHGIFELPAIMLSVVCAFLVTQLEINLIKGTLQNTKTFKGELKNSSTIIKDIILSITIIIILLVIAALIEGFATATLAKILMDIFGLGI